MEDFKKLRIDKNAIRKKLIQNIIRSMEESFLFNFGNPWLKKSVKKIPRFKKLKNTVDKRNVQPHKIFKYVDQSPDDALYDLADFNLIDSKFNKPTPDEIKEIQKEAKNISGILQPMSDEINELRTQLNLIEPKDNLYFKKYDADIPISLEINPADKEIKSSRQLQYSETSPHLFKEDYIIHTRPKIIKRKIEYKKVDANYFNDNGFIADDIHFEFTGNYILNDFLQKLDWGRKDTTVVNIGTGDGKSTLAHHLIRKYAESGFIVIIASPYIVLTNRDYIKLKQNLSEKIKIVNYTNLNSRNVDKFIDANIHSITINSLLGNPGGDSENLSNKQSRIKKKYLNDLRKYCETNNKKVVIFFDEIHAGIDNFKSRFIANLFEWKKLVHKTFVFSATYTEASNIVLNYIARLTDNKLTIFNSDRRKFINQGNLHINITKRQYTSKDISPLNYIIKIVKDALERDEKINILVGTQSLVNTLTDSKSKEPLAQYLVSLKPNILIGKKSTGSNKKQFNENKVNIGTTFYTGISIKDPKNTFIIITPVFIGPDSQRMASIFMNGAPAITQALARVRNGGNIHVFMNMPTHLVNGEYKKKIPKFLKKLKNARYIDSSKQSEIVENQYRAYNKHMHLLSEKSQINIDNLSYLTKNVFILTRSQYELASKYEIFGKKVNPFIIWAAYNDQFTNCTLSSVNLIDEPKKQIEVKEVTITSDLKKLLSPNIKTKIINLPDKKALNILIEDISVSNETTDFGLNIKNDIYYQGKLIKPDQLRYYPKLIRSLINILYQLKFNEDMNYDKSMYILGNISMSKKVVVKNNSDTRNNLKAAYSILGKILDDLSKEINENTILTTDLISDQLEKDFCIAFSELKENDFYIKQKIFSFLQTYAFNFTDNGDVNFYIKNKEKRHKILLNGLSGLFIETKSKHIRENGKIVRRKISVKLLNPPQKSINLIFD